MKHNYNLQQQLVTNFSHNNDMLIPPRLANKLINEDFCSVEEIFMARFSEEFIESIPNQAGTWVII